MANTAQARKRARQAEATRQRNASLKSSLRTAIKKVRKAIGAGDKAAATKELQAQQSVIDRIADKKVVHKNTASRSKARLAQAIKALPSELRLSRDHERRSGALFSPENRPALC